MSTAPIELMLSRLEDVKRNGDGWMALCPAHADHDPSLSVKEGDAGQVLLHCFAGCSVESVLDAAGLTWGDLFESTAGLATTPGYDECHQAGMLFAIGLKNGKHYPDMNTARKAALAFLTDDYGENASRWFDAGYRTWIREQPAPVVPQCAEPEPHVERLSQFIDWPTFWACDYTEAEWLYPDVLARGRGHSIYAARKEGKSLFALAMAAKLATGSEQIVVLYLDYEMTEADLFERLGDMGYGAESDLSRLCYLQLPTIPKLDTAAGGQALMEMVDTVKAEWPEHELVAFFDTYGRTVEGKEDSADTTRAFYNHTGIALKRRGVTWVRIDHSGKDESKGARGSSAKGDDVDVVWKLTHVVDRVTLHRDAARMAWVPEKVTFRQTECPLTYERCDEGHSAVAERVAAALDRLGVPKTTSANAAVRLLREAGEGCRKDTVLAAQRLRRKQC